MFHHPPFRKIYPVVASRRAMFALANRHSEMPYDENRISGMIYAGEWFEVEHSSYDEMLSLLPPLLVRPDMYAVSVFNGGRVAIVFVMISISGRQRWFLGFCDLSVLNSPQMLRDAIVARETAPHPERLSRDEQLEVIWNATHAELRGYAPITDPDHRSPYQRDRRTLLINDRAGGSKLCFLETLTSAQIKEWLPGDVTYIAMLGESGSGHSQFTSQK